MRAVRRSGRATSAARIQPFSAPLLPDVAGVPGITLDKPQSPSLCSLIDFVKPDDVIAGITSNGVPVREVDIPDPTPSMAKSWGPHWWGSDLVIGRHTVFPSLEWDVGESLFPHVRIDRFGSWYSYGKVCHFP